MDTTNNKKHRKDNTNRTRTKSKTTATKRTDTGNDTSAEAYSNYSRLLQLFPYLHPVAIDRIFASCNRDFVRTIDNLLYIKRYVYFVQLNGYHPHTDPNAVVVDEDSATENNQPTNTGSSSFTEMHDDNNNSNTGVSGDGYIPNGQSIKWSVNVKMRHIIIKYVCLIGNIAGIREQIRTYEEERNQTESEYNSSLDTEVNIFQLSPCNGGAGYNFYTSTPSDVNVHDEICYLQLGN